MIALKYCTLAFALCTPFLGYSQNDPVTEWVGPTLHVNVQNNTSTKLIISTFWTGKNLPKMSFPEGDSVSPFTQVGFDVIDNDYVEGSSYLGVKVRKGFGEITCRSEIQLALNSDKTFRMDSFTGYYWVSTGDESFDCSTRPVDFSSGAITLVINEHEKS